MGNVISYNHSEGQTANDRHNEQSKQLKSPLLKPKPEEVQLKQFHQDFFVQNKYIDTTEEYDNIKNQRQIFKLNHLEAQMIDNKKLISPNAMNRHVSNGQQNFEREFQNKTIFKQQKSPKNTDQPNYLVSDKIKQDHLPRKSQLIQENSNVSIEENVDSNISSIQQSVESFRSSFMSDTSQTTIYLEPPQFILRSPFLMDILHSTIYEFFLFAQFMGWLAIKIFKTGVHLIYITLILNILLLISQQQCLKTKNNGFIELQKWLMLDCAFSSAILVLLGSQYVLYTKYSQRTSARRKYVKNAIKILQTSWIIIFLVKFFILNTTGSAQFFNYTYNNKPNDVNNVKSQLFDTQINKESDNDTNIMASFVKCPMPVNVYLVGLLVYNYITIVFLCVFVVENLV